MVQILKFTLLALVCAAILVLALTLRPQGRLAQTLGRRPVGIVAKDSYALYVFHPVIFKACKPLYDRLPFAICLLTAFSATGVAAFLSWHLIESPFLRLRDVRPVVIYQPSATTQDRAAA